MGGRKRPDPESHPGTTIREADWPTELETVRRLFQDYRGWLAHHRDPAASAELDVETGLGQIDKQIAELPGAYGPPRGVVLLAFAGSDLVACGALRRLEAKSGEIKRIFVRQDHRGPGFGVRLTRALLDRANDLGYEKVRVDTLPTMAAAIQFYQEMGFDPIPAYWPHPALGALFFEYRAGKSNPRPGGRAKSRSKRRPT